MAYIFGKDLDNWDNSLITREPYAITDKDTSIGSQYVTGADLLRSAKISPEWKQPVAQLAQAYSKTALSGQIASKYLTGLADSIAELPYNVENALAQRAIELVSGKEKDKSFTRKLYEGTEIGKLEKIGSTLLSLGIIIPGLMEDAKEIRQKATTYEEIVDLLNEREYPSAKYAQRIIAENTSAVENRRLVRELYNQSLGIDSSKWYNEAASIIGAMTPIIAASRFGYSTALRAGASRAGAIKVAENIVKGYVGLESAGQYAEETASEYLKRTGDKTFENFTAKDASGLASMAYGAISGQIEVLGGVEPIMAGALSRVGLRSGLLKAGIKIGAGEATEEFLQSISEFLMRKMDNTTNKTWGEALKDALNGAAWGLFIGGITGSPAFYINRRNLVKGIRQALPNISDSQATQVADIMIDSVAEQSSQDPTLRQNLRNKIATMYETADIENKEDRIDAITDLEYALITADATWDGINIAEHPLFQGEVNQLGWFRAGVSEQIRPVVNSLISELTDLQEQLKKLNEAKEKDWGKIDEIERKLEQFDRYVLDKLGENAPASIRALENELRKVEERYVAKEKKKAGIPVDVIKTTQTSDHDYGNVIQEDVVEESKNGVKYWFITDRNGGGRIRLLTPENKIIGQININKNGVRYLYLEPEYRSDKYGKLLWDEAQRFTNPSEVMATGREDTPVERAIGFWKKQGFKQVGETPKMTREIDKTKQLEPFPENQMSTAMFQEQFDLADENARLDDIYPAYEGETIVVDGKERTVYNSEGKRIAKSKEALTNFWKWFSDSKVVDEQGRPLVVYHGTSSVFDTFDSGVGHITDSGFFGSGFYFTPIKSEAEYYGRIVMPVYLKIEKPFTISTGGYYSGLYDNLFEGGGQLLKDLGLLAENDLKDFNKYERLKKEFLKKTKVEKIYTYDAKHNEVQVWRASFEKDGRSYEANSYRPWEEIGYNEKEDTKENALNNAWGEYAHFKDLNFLIQDLSFTDYIRTNGLAEELSNIIKSRGYDGTIAGDEHIVFEPNQIKSVDNRGTYSEKTGNIYYQPGFASMPVKNLVATHAATKFGVEQALKVGGFAMPSLAIKKDLDSNYGEIVFIAPASMAQPSRTTKVYDRDAWTPLVNFIEYKSNDWLYEHVKDILKEHGLNPNSASSFIYNIEEGIKEADAKWNAKALELFFIDNNIDVRADMDINEMRRMVIDSDSDLRDKYYKWYNEVIINNTTPRIFKGFTKVKGYRRYVPATLDNIVAELKTQPEHKDFSWQDMYDFYDVMREVVTRFKDVKSIKKASDRLKDPQEIQMAVFELNSEFNRLASELNKDPDNLNSHFSLGNAIIDGTGSLAERLGQVNLKNDPESVKKVEDLIAKIKQIPVRYFEGKPRRAVRFDEFSAAFVPSRASYNEIADQLTEQGVNVLRYGSIEERDELFNKLVLTDEDIMFQNRVSGNAPATYRGAYIPQYRFIQRTNKMDASSLSHELAHDWFEVNFDKFRSGNGDPEFMRAWGTLEKALGITEKSTKAEKAKASETFARAYEGWIMNKPDWTKAINIDDNDKDAVIKLMQDYQNNLRDIYQDLTSPYFKQTWGKLGEMKPEIKNWFDKVINIRDLDVLVERGEITQEQANQERINQAIDTVIANTEDADTKRALQNAKVLNDTSRYEAEGGNKNSLQRRIATLAKAIDENNMLIKENYDTHRDMLEVAKQADNFVRTRFDDALAIINGQMAEQEGLFKEDIYTALERLALENGDLNLLDELKNSEIANRLAKELGQRVAGFRNWNAGEIDVVSTIKTLDNKFNQALKNKKAQAQMKEATELFESAQKEQDKLADKQLETFLKDVECK